MKQKIISVILILISLLTNGCLRTYYPAAYRTSSPVMVSETNNKPDTSSKYLGVDLTLSKGDYDSENLQLFKVSYLLANTQDHTNINLEGFGYTGYYKVVGLHENYDGAKNFIGLGGNVNLSVNFKIEDFKFGAGIDFGLGLEFGEYYSFRKDAGRAGVIDDENSPLFIMPSLFPVFSYQFSESTILSAQVNIGAPGLISPSIVLNNNQFVYWLSWVPEQEISFDNYGHRIAFGIKVGLNNFEPIL